MVVTIDQTASMDSKLFNVVMNNLLVSIQRPNIQTMIFVLYGYIPSFVCIRGRGGTRGTFSIGSKLIHNQQTVSTQLHYSPTAAHLRGTYNITTLTEDRLPRVPGNKTKHKF